jgi:hypothetical protein
MIYRRATIGVVALMLLLVALAVGSYLAVADAVSYHGDFPSGAPAKLRSEL